MKKTIRLTENELIRLIKNIINEDDSSGLPVFNQGEIERLMGKPSDRVEPRGFKPNDKNRPTKFTLKRGGHTFEVTKYNDGRYGGWTLYIDGKEMWSKPHDECDVELDKAIRYNWRKGYM